MADDARYRTLVETPEYEAQLESLAQVYSDEVLESAIQGVLRGKMCEDPPERHDKVTGNIWRSYMSRSFDPEHPSFKIFFGIPNESEVLLVWIEEIGGTEEIEG